MASFQKTPAGIGTAETLSPGESDTGEGVYRAQYDSTPGLENYLTSATAGRSVIFQYTGVDETVDSEETATVSEHDDE